MSYVIYLLPVFIDDKGSYRMYTTNGRFLPSPSIFFYRIINVIHFFVYRLLDVLLSFHVVPQFWLEVVPTKTTAFTITLYAKVMMMMNDIRM